ncbi:MAG: hypothetical protein EHM45_02120 [Desulfobacteraceae bacterium]|nr:MAG: hypothetical protein EHM45_02120 [Desulfobacteraceae bacterium]
MLLRPFHSLARIISRNHFRILFYHRVNTSKNPFIIDPAQFEVQIRYLAGHFNILGLSEFLDLIAGRKPIRNGLLITFDDGYQDNYTHAYPVLKKYGLPAAIFLTTDFIDGTHWLWFDKIRYVLEALPSGTPTAEIGGRKFTLNLTDEIAKGETRLRIYLHLNSLDYRPRMEAILTWAGRMNLAIPDKPVGEYAPLSWDQVREMAKNRIEFGSHTRSHEILSHLKPMDAVHEFAHSKKRIETELQRPVCTVAYPNGQSSDYNEETKRLAQQCGYHYAFTTQSELIGDFRKLDRLAIGRIFPGVQCDDFFRSNITGLNSIKKNIKEILPKYRSFLKAAV